MLEIKDEYNVIGVMSGTSVDGIDLCYATYSYKLSAWSFSINYCETIKYKSKWIDLLLNSHRLSKSDLNNLDFKYTNLLAEVINSFISKNKIDKIDFISSHGHTVFHDPENKKTFQIGNRIELMNITEIPVVCNFREQDVILGGQGAPLVPVGDLLLFSDYDYCINLGGFSNISVKSKKKIIAYDICPLNIVLNHYSKTIGLNYDKDGKLAALGKINNCLYSKLNNLSYYKNKYPKSLGLEYVENTIFPLIDSYNLSVKDILRTYVEHISFQIDKNIINHKSNILFSGGGVKNKFLIKRLSNKIKNSFQIKDYKIIDFKEALIFGFLGVLRVRNEVNCLKSVTGASKDHSSGLIFK